MNTFWKFGLVGIINTLTDVLIFTALHSAVGMPLLLANIISTSVALAVSFMLNRRFTFPTDKVSNRRTALYIIVTLGGLWVLAPLTIKALMNLDMAIHYTQPFVSLFGHPDVFHSMLPKLGSVVVTLTWNYIWYSRVVFMQHRKDINDN